MRRRIDTLIHSGLDVFGGFLRFLSRPSPDIGLPRSWFVTAAWLLVFTYAATGIFALIALPLLLASGGSAAGGLQAVGSRPLLSVILAIVVLGPLVEEVAFRGWLKGTVGAVLGTALFAVLWFGASGWLARAAAYPLDALLLTGLAGLAVAAFLAGSRVGRNRVIPGVGPLFPVLFWLQGLVFGVLHVINFDSLSPTLTALMAGPYIVVGWVWGYARLVLGLPAACLLHAIYNLPPAVALSVMGGLPLLD